jgi:hypothetical protein
MRTAILVIVASLIASGAAAQGTDDARWVDQCVRDSASYNVSERVKVLYCSCMVSKMSDSESRSVTQWERANQSAARDCAKRAGWS